MLCNPFFSLWRNQRYLVCLVSHAAVWDAVGGWGCAGRCFLGAAPCCDGERMPSSFAISPEGKGSPEEMETITSGYGTTSTAWSVGAQGDSAGWIDTCPLTLAHKKYGPVVLLVNVSGSVVGSG